MKSRTKPKPRVTQLSVLQSIDRKVGTMLRFVEPAGGGAIEFPTPHVECVQSYALRPTLIKLAPNGERLPETFKGEHLGVLIPGVLPKQDLIIDARKPTEKYQWARAVEVGAQIELYRQKAELWLPEHAQLIIRRDRRDPACDKNFFPHMPSDWIWTRLPVEPASSSGRAWFVNLSTGRVDWDGRDDYGFVVGSRLVPAGQF